MTTQILDDRAFDPFAAEDELSVAEPRAAIWGWEPDLSEASADAGRAAARAAGPTNGDDTLRGSGDADSIDGLAGNDQIYGLGGDDTLTGGKGVDTIYGGFGNDLIVDYVGASEFHAGDGNDTLKSGRGADTLYGDAGADNIDAGAGNDFIDGGEGSDLLVGGAGRDTIVGGGGADNLTGGTGGDRFVINGKGLVAVSIADFEVGKDMIEISGFRRVDDFSDLKIEFGGCGLMIYDQAETFSIALLNYFGSLDESDFMFS